MFENVNNKTHNGDQKATKILEYTILLSYWTVPSSVHVPI